MPDPSPNHARAIGEKLRAVRQQRQMSLRDLAEKAEVSASMLSQIETGKAYPSVRSIYNIAAALAVPVDYFFPEPAGDGASQPAGSEAAVPLTASDLREARLNRPDDPTAREFGAPPAGASPVVHAASRPTIELKGGVTWARLTSLAEAGAEFLEISYAPGATSGANMSHHAGREFGLVLAGELVIELGFDAHTLSTGDSIIFDSSTPHRLSNQSTAPTRALWVVLTGT
jgi:transcriptional regulator with XRE-family HTH domain/mannose-6-phosphate isomerase-like protein (cupin superfamily)